MANSHLRVNVKGTQSLPRVLAFRVDGSVVTTSAATTGLLEGTTDATVAKGSGGASNEVTFTWDEAFARVPVITCTCIGATVVAHIKSVTATGCVIETFTASTGAAADDADFHMMVHGWDSANIY